MYLAVFGDVHGNLDAVYENVKRWEQQNNSQIQAVLQVGDLGVFQWGGRLDKATDRFAKEDISELGCADYIIGEKVASHSTLFVRGNHEDFDFLQAAGAGCIDPEGMIRHLHAGEVVVIRDGVESVRVGGLGGISGQTRRGGVEDVGRKNTADSEYDRLLSLSPGTTDVLLFHEAPRGFGNAGALDSGSEEITLIIEHHRPRFAFYGHYGRPPDPFLIGQTTCVGMNSPRALRLPRRDGAMGILNTTCWTFDFVPKNVSWGVKT